MKTHNLIKNVVKTVFVLSLLFVTASCSNDDSDDDDNTDVAFVSLPEASVKSYTGNLAYTPSNPLNAIVNTEGTATISKSGSTYTISFSDDVPSITGLKFINNNNQYASVSEDGSAVGISIDGESLSIGASIGSEQWAFSSDD